MKDRIKFSPRSVGERNRQQLAEAMKKSPDLDAIVSSRPRAGWDKSIPVTLCFLPVLLRSTSQEVSCARVVSNRSAICLTGLAQKPTHAHHRG